MAVTKPTPLTDLLIRPAEASDMNTIFDFVCELEETSFDLPVFQEVFQQNLSNPMIHYLVADLAGAVVGFISCHVQYLLHHCGKVGEIQELFVKPDYRDQRIGHQFVAALDELAIREQFINLEVTTNQKRMDTIRFYERESFNRTHIKLVKPIQ